ncbi:acyl-CoA dehydrogenase [Flavobacterium tegetincola]|uniref:acyl-CoA dehydrogenase family protein n=1 Tax=Flavobacterium tegetincola TaxID=150172 RepID=UPI00040CB385|nr:acyl-CoA dehydrogenase [Flavobacterium tegetincola]
MFTSKSRLFLPLLYIVWSDDLLTADEFNTLSTFIKNQAWLSEDEKSFLESHLNLSIPPTRSDLNAWRKEIAEMVAVNPTFLSFYDLQLKVSADTSLDQYKSLFEKLEQDLGILGSEALLNFTKNNTNQTYNYETNSSFDVVKMTAILDGNVANAINEVKKVISSPEFAYENTTDVHVYREKVLEWCHILAQKNLGNRAYPKKYGGGENLAEYFAIMETLSFHDLSLVIKFGVQFGLWGMSIQSLGTEKHYEKYLNKVGKLELPGCFAMTETHHGSNVKGLQTTATYNHDDQTFTINTPTPKDQKEYIGNAAAHGQMATVFAKLIIDDTDYGVNAFIVPIRDKNNKSLSNVEINDCGLKMGLNGVDNGTISFHKVVIPKENMLDKFASVNKEGVFESPIPSDNRRFFTMLGTLVGGRIGIPRSALAAAKSGLAITIRYSDQRRQFGPEGGSEIPILNYRMHQRRLIPPVAKTYAFHFALRYLTQRYIDKKPEEMQEIEALAAGLKAYTTWHTTATLQECREACGGKGYLSENRIDRLKNDTEVYTTFEGDNTVLMQLVAKNRLSVFRKSVSEMDSMDKVSYVWNQTKVYLSERNPFATRDTSDTHLLDAAFHLNAFYYREHEITVSAAKRIKNLIDSGLNAYDAFNVVQHQMIDVAKAYLDRVVLEQFLHKIETIKEVATKSMLQKLAQVFALHKMEENRAWYLENNYMEAVKSKAIRKMVNQLCWEIRPDAVALVDAFGIPESCLAAPIAKKI